MKVSLLNERILIQKAVMIADEIGNRKNGWEDYFSCYAKVYYKINEVHIELYTDFKDLAVEQQVEDVLDGHGIFYNKSEVWIESEKLYEVVYIFDWEV